MLVFKLDILEELKEHGYNTNRIRKENIFGQKTLQDIKQGIVPGIKSIDKLCEILEMQPGNFLKYVDKNERKTD